MDNSSLSNATIPKPQSRSFNADFNDIEERSNPHVDPPPPYPSRDRRTRAGNLRSMRRMVPPPNTERSSSGGIEITSDDNTGVNERSPLLSSTRRRRRTVSHSSVLTEESSQSLTQTILSLFEADEESDTSFSETRTPRNNTNNTNIQTKTRRYFRPLLRKSYYLSLCHLMMINFPFALLCFLFLFIGTLVSICRHITINNEYELTRY